MTYVKYTDKWNEPVKNEKWTDDSIGAEGAKAMSESLMKNTTLTILGLGGDGKETNVNDMKEMRDN